MRAGQLTEKVRWYRVTNRTNEYNEVEEQYLFMSEIRADIQLSNSTITVADDREVVNQSMTCSVRIYNDVRVNDRIYYQDSYWEVDSAVNDRRLQRRLLILKRITE